MEYPDFTQKISVEREIKYQDFVAKLQNEISCTTSNTHTVLSGVADDVEKIHDTVKKVQVKTDEIDKKLDRVNHKLKTAEAMADTDY